MTYSFKPVEHHIYQNTFLKDVRVAVEFSPVDTDSVKKDQLQKFFNKFKGTNIDVNDFLTKENISVISSNREVEFLFSLSYAEAKLSTPFYSTFDSAIQYWQLLLDYMNAIGVCRMEGIMVRKYSEFSFRSNNADFKFKDVMSEVFSGELMEKIPQNTSFNGLNSFEKTWMEKDEDSGSTFNVVFGFKKADTNTKYDHLTLVTSLEMNNGPIGLDGFIDKIKEYNAILYNAFHWCVKEEIIKEMN
ncbi:MAG: hypothetical protein J6S89_08155 [Paludibacteraceae bacterium]|nr:hypothetical protein [Paludibacteraceae bacterium]MBP5664537.1 hypothetical protein [Bacteroidales bacterium]